MSARVDPEVAPQLGARGIERKEDSETDAPRGLGYLPQYMHLSMEIPPIGEAGLKAIGVRPEVNPALIGPVWRTLDANRGSMRFHCSACGGIAYWPQAHRGDDKGRRRCGYRICPWCGARMRGTDNGDDD